MALGYCQFGGRKETRWPWDIVSSVDVKRQDGPGILSVRWILSVKRQDGPGILSVRWT